MSIEREELEVDVLCVGAGPASLSCALHLSRLIEDHNERGKEPLLEPLILIIEKGREVGSHALSGAVIDPRGFNELIKSLDIDESPPYEAQVKKDSLYYLTQSKAIRSPIIPPPLNNDGHYIASIGKLVKWMAGLCEERGIEVYPGFPGAELLFEEDTVSGVRIADSGVDKEGTAKSNFQPGMDVRAKISVLSEGPRGTLTGQAIKRFELDSESQPQVYAVGVKELWKAGTSVEPGRVIHTLGFPLEGEFGGGFIYSRQDNLIDVGFVVRLDYEDPRTDSHLLLQQFKNHPLVSEFLRGGQLVAYGAKAIPEGGLYAMPRLYHDGLLIVGDSGGFLNSQRLKGIHLAIKSGMLAAETIFNALRKKNTSAEQLSVYERKFQGSWAREELWKVRNFRQSFQSGFKSGLFRAGLQFLTGGRGFQDPHPIAPGHEMMKQVSKVPKNFKQSQVSLDSKITFDKLKCLYHSGTSHEEDQPSHLKILKPSICAEQCTREYGNPCQHFCPAAVYEIDTHSTEGRLSVNFSNCVHCKTCEIMDPYQVILWTPPEGGGGPDWKMM